MSRPPSNDVRLTQSVPTGDALARSSAAVTIAVAPDLPCFAAGVKGFTGGKLTRSFAPRACPPSLESRSRSSPHRAVRSCRLCGNVSRRRSRSERSPASGSDPDRPAPRWCDLSAPAVRPFGSGSDRKRRGGGAGGRRTPGGPDSRMARGRLSSPAGRGVDSSARPRSTRTPTCTRLPGGVAGDGTRVTCSGSGASAFATVRGAGPLSRHG